MFQGDCRDIEKMGSQRQEKEDFVENLSAYLEKILLQRRKAIREKSLQQMREIQKMDYRKKEMTVNKSI